MTYISCFLLIDIGRLVDAYEFENDYQFQFEFENDLQIGWNLFEQSGHFKNVEKEMGYDGIDVDCVKTDHTDYVMDLLAEMDKWEKGEESIFDEIKQDDFVFSFFPCIRFEKQANMLILGNRYPDRYKSMLDHLDISREREVCGMDTFAYFARLCL